MKGTVLERIVNDKKISIAQRKRNEPLNSFIADITPSKRDFYAALGQSPCVFILECKKASPSKGLIRADFDPASIAKTYEPFASAISVLTDEKYFQGESEFLTQVSNAVALPVLCKDFIVDSYQVYLARSYQADAILLMLSVLNDEQYRELSKLAHSLSMGVLTEVSTEDELQRAINLKAKVVGINNRDLRDLSIDLNRTRQFAPKLAKDTIVISESGIENHQHIRELSHHVNGFLIGSALMSQPILTDALHQLILGTHKVCGLTRAQDAIDVYQSGATYGGLIFAEKSKRHVTLMQAQQIINAAPLKYVGVFQNQSINHIHDMARLFTLSAVQLHGQEDADFIAQLRAVLPKQCQIWKAIDMSKDINFEQYQQVDRLVLDNGSGGTGHTFDWAKIPKSFTKPMILAGGLSADNCSQAMKLGITSLDFNSGVESEPGIKDKHKLQQVFTKLRDYA